MSWLDTSSYQLNVMWNTWNICSASVKHMPYKKKHSGLIRGGFSSTNTLARDLCLWESWKVNSNENRTASLNSNKDLSASIIMTIITDSNQVNIVYMFIIYIILIDIAWQYLPRTITINNQKPNQLTTNDNTNCTSLNLSVKLQWSSNYSAECPWYTLEN